MGDESVFNTMPLLQFLYTDFKITNTKLSNIITNWFKISDKLNRSLITSSKPEHKHIFSQQPKQGRKEAKHLRKKRELAAFLYPSVCRCMGESPETLQKLCVLKKFPFQKLR